MFELVLICIGVLAALWLFGSVGKSTNSRGRSSRSSAAPRSNTTSRREPYAELQVGNSYRDLSSADVTELLKPLRERARDRKPTFRRLGKAVEKAWETGIIPDQLRQEITEFIAVVTPDANEIDRLQSDLYFSTEAGVNRLDKLLNDIDEQKIDVETMLDQLDEIESDIRDGEYEV